MVLKLKGPLDFNLVLYPKTETPCYWLQTPNLSLAQVLIWVRRLVPGVYIQSSLFFVHDLKCE